MKRDGLLKRMNEWRVLIVVTLAFLLVADINLLLHPRAHTYSGLGIHGNLIWIQQAKERWEIDHKGKVAWPTMQDLLPYGVSNIRPVYGEIYLINETGAPAFVYFPKTAWGFHEGQTISLNEEDMGKVEMLVRQSQ